MLLDSIGNLVYLQRGNYLQLFQLSDEGEFVECYSTDGRYLTVLGELPAAPPLHSLALFCSNQFVFCVCADCVIVKSPQINVAVPLPNKGEDFFVDVCGTVIEDKLYLGSRMDLWLLDMSSAPRLTKLPLSLSTGGSKDITSVRRDNSILRHIALLNTGCIAVLVESDLSGHSAVWLLEDHTLTRELTVFGRCLLAYHSSLHLLMLHTPCALQVLDPFSLQPRESTSSPVAAPPAAMVCADGTIVVNYRSGELVVFRLSSAAAGTVAEVAMRLRLLPFASRLLAVRCGERTCFVAAHEHFGLETFALSSAAFASSSASAAEQSLYADAGSVLDDIGTIALCTALSG